MGVQFKFLAWELEGRSPGQPRVFILSLCASGLQLSPGRGRPSLSQRCCCMDRGTQSKAQGR